MSRKMRIRALELFAGIGGQALALKAAGVKTIGYCEIDDVNCDILRANMERGRLDRAPIFSDVKKLTRKDLPNKRVDMIAGGFPCLGLSGLGKRKGLYGDSRSNLIQHVFRLVDELKPSYVFLENVPNILRDKHFRDMVGRFTRMGYRCAFIVSTASQLGAKHLRARWFMLCARENAVPFTPTDNVSKLTRYFDQRVKKKLLPKGFFSAKIICRAFGNCVVPAQAHLALVTLMKTLEKPIATLERVPFSRIDSLKPTVAMSPSQFYQDTSYPVPSAVCRGSGYNVVPPQPPRSYESKASLPLLTQPFTSLCFPTPSTSSWCCSPIPTMTKRSKTMTANFLLSTKEMWDRRKPGHDERMMRMLSDEFLAAAMGFPRDWIRSVLVAEKP